MKKIAVFLFLVALSLAGRTEAQDSATYLRQGLEAERNGETEKALNIWLKGKARSEPDPRIGFQFIRAVTEDSLTGYYEFASLMYDWGLQVDGWSPAYAEAMEKEIERTGLLASDETLSELRKLHRREDSALYGRLRDFWRRRDATPLSAQNERLLEHWERIGHARKHFDRGSDSPIDTDERGPVYVRYGPPDLVRSGHLQFSAAQADNWITNIWAQNMLNPNPSDVPSKRVAQIVKEVRSYYTFPEYEVWVYRELRTDRNESTIYMFGTAGETGGYRQIEQVEDFIPNAAFSMGNMSARDRTFSHTGSVPSKIRAGLILQLMYYDQLAAYDQYFGSMLQQIESRALNRGGLSLGLMQEMKTAARAELVEARRRSPREESAYEEQMLEIPMEVHQYRLLDREGSPYLATFVESAPRQAFWYDYIRNYTGGRTDSAEVRARQQNLRYYELVHGMQAYGENGELLGQARDDPQIATGAGATSLSVMSIPYAGEGTEQVFSAELRNRDPESEYAVDLPFPDELRGLGKAAVPQPPPLEEAGKPLAMGDLVVGYGLREGADGELFPFTVANDHRIPGGRELVLHFEVYNLPADTGGIASFELDYQVRPEESGLWSWTREQARELTVTLNLQTEGDSYRENLQIDTGELQPGTYVMEITARDPGSGRETAREFAFEIFGPGD